MSLNNLVAQTSDLISRTDTDLLVSGLPLDTNRVFGIEFHMATANSYATSFRYWHGPHTFKKASARDIPSNLVEHIPSSIFSIFAKTIPIVAPKINQLMRLYRDGFRCSCNAQHFRIVHFNFGALIYHIRVPACHTEETAEPNTVPVNDQQLLLINSALSHHKQIEARRFAHLFVDQMFS